VSAETRPTDPAPTSSPILRAVQAQSRPEIAQERLSRSPSELVRAAAAQAAAQRNGQPTAAVSPLVAAARAQAARTSAGA
jgi:hypothetical protein